MARFHPTQTIPDAAANDTFGPICEVTSVKLV
jgi:hypothetical protein